MGEVGARSVSDLFHAPPPWGRWRQAVNLRFNHRMVKVEFTLAAGDGITEEEIEGANVTLFSDAKAYFSGGMVGTADQSDGEIKTVYPDATNLLGNTRRWWFHRT